MDGHDEVQAGENRGKSSDKDGKAGLNHLGVAGCGAVRRVEGPTSIHATGQCGVHHEDAGDDEEIPAQQIDSGECQILCPNHQGDKKISQDGGDGRNQKEEHHDLAMHAEQFVVGVGLNEVARRSEQFETNQQGEESADKEKECNRS